MTLTPPQPVQFDDFYTDEILKQRYATALNRASLTSPFESPQALFRAAAVAAPKHLAPLQARSGHPPEQNGKIAVFADTAQNTHPDTNNGDSASRPLQFPPYIVCARYLQ
jgi:hypothetical protein